MTTHSRVTRHGQVTLPASVRRELGIQEGDLVEVVVEDEKAVIVPKRIVDKSQAYFWTKEWQEAEREASADIAAGRVETFDTAADLLKELDGK